MSDESGSQFRTYASYLLAVLFVVVFLGMVVLTAQVILDAI